MLTAEKWPNVRGENFREGKRWMNAARRELSRPEPSPRTVPTSAA